MINNALRSARIALLTFTISLVISFISEVSLAAWISVGILAIVLVAGILFDIIGTAVTAANEMPFHAMGADKVQGSRQAIYLIRNADKVANFCNDVVGDISGTVSGALIVSIVFEFGNLKNLLGQDLLNPIAIAFIAALTVGGKAFGKSFAIERANQIVFNVGKLLSFLNLAQFEPKKDKHKGKNSSRRVRRS